MGFFSVPRSIGAFVKGAQQFVVEFHLGVAGGGRAGGGVWCIRVAVFTAWKAGTSIPGGQHAGCSGEGEALGWVSRQVARWGREVDMGEHQRCSCAW